MDMSPATSQSDVKMGGYVTSAGVYVGESYPIDRAFTADRRRGKQCPIVILLDQACMELVSTLRKVDMAH